MLLPKLPTTGGTGLFIALGLLVFVAAGCEDNNPLRKRAAERPTPATVEETFTLLRECRQTGAYGAMRPHIKASGREGIIDLLIAVDELIAANAAAIAVVERACPGLDTKRYDLAAVIQDNLELFSRDVDLVDVQVSGDKAVLTVQIAQRLPLHRLDFERHDGVWQYLPGSERPEIIKAIRQRARKLNQIAMSLDREGMTPERIHYEFRVRLGRSAQSLGRQFESPVPLIQSSAGSVQ